MDMFFVDPGLYGETPSDRWTIVIQDDKTEVNERGLADRPDGTDVGRYTCVYGRTDEYSERRNRFTMYHRAMQMVCLQIEIVNDTRVRCLAAAPFEVTIQYAQRVIRVMLPAEDGTNVLEFMQGRSGVDELPLM